MEDFKDAVDYEEYPSEHKNNFMSANILLENMGRKKSYEKALFQSPFHEITSHSIEGLYKEFNTSNLNTNDYGRRILKSVIKEVQNNFLELDADFIINYPDAHKAFNERIFELANIGKLNTQQLLIQDADNYFIYRQERRDEKLKESVISTNISNSSTSIVDPSIYEPANEVDLIDTNHQYSDS